MDFTTRKFTIWAHIVFWVVYYALNFVFYSKFLAYDDVLLKTLIACSFHITIVTINISILLPKYFFPRKFGMYFGIFVPLFALTVLGLVVIETAMLPKMQSVYESATIEHVMSSIISTLIVTSITAMLRFLQEWYKQQEKARKLAYNKLEADHKMLRMQVNPHFLFNALNNIYYMAYKKMDETAPAILKLSDLMRFMLYESDDRKIPLQKEIDYIQNYLGLEELKHGDTNHKITFEIAGSTHREVEPLLMIPFVENAFKHGNLEDNDSFLHINIDSEEDAFIFKIRNSFDPDDQQKDEVGGVGIENVKNRLQIYYPEKHVLNIKKDSNIYSVELIIDVI